MIWFGKNGINCRIFENYASGLGWSLVKSHDSNENAWLNQIEL